MVSRPATWRRNRRSKLKQYQEQFAFTSHMVKAWIQFYPGYDSNGTNMHLYFNRSILHTWLQYQCFKTEWFSKKGQVFLNETLWFRNRYNIYKCVKYLYNIVTYWPSTEPSIKRWTSVNKRKNSETGASGRRYRNITLTSGRGWSRWWQMRTLTGSWWTPNNYITRRHRRLELQLEFQLLLESVGDKMPEWEPAPDGGLGPSVTHGWAAQPECERSAAMVRRTLGQYVAVVPVSSSPLTHNQYQRFRE